MATAAIAQVEFPFLGARGVRALFDAGPISSDGGALLLRQADRRLALLDTLAAVLPDHRDPRHIAHTNADLLRQRVYAIALGYEDCNDATILRRDPVLKTCCDRDPNGRDLASQPTLSRLENEVGPKTCYQIADQILESYFVRHATPPERIVLDLDTTHDPAHGQQEFAAFHGFYDEHIYLPLLVFDGAGDLLTAVLQPGTANGVGAAAAVMKRILRRIRLQWPSVPILVRGDSGFGAPAMYRVCELYEADFVFGLQPNVRLKALAAPIQERARRRFLRRGSKVRLFSSMRYAARRNRWPRAYRVLIKAEHQAIGPNVRFVVTTLKGPAQKLYDDCYVQRGEAAENSIKDLKTALKADRLSCHRFWANQFRLLLHAAAYLLMYAIRRAADGTELQDAQMDTLRLRLLKIGVRVESTARRVWFHLSSSHPWQRIWTLVAARLVTAAPG